MCEEYNIVVAVVCSLELSQPWRAVTRTRFGVWTASSWCRISLIAPRGLTKTELVAHARKMANKNKTSREQNVKQSSKTWSGNSHLFSFLFLHGRFRKCVTYPWQPLSCILPQALFGPNKQTAKRTRCWADDTQRIWGSNYPGVSPTIPVSTVCRRRGYSAFDYRWSAISSFVVDDGLARCWGGWPFRACTRRLEKREREMGMRFAAVTIRVAWCEVQCVTVP